MNIQEKMSLAAAEIKQRIANGEIVNKEDRKFLQSFVSINSKQAFNAGKRRNSSKVQKA